MVMPNFLIIGAAKSGTTSLYNYLAQHPEVFMSKVKEPRFFAVEKNPPNIGNDPVRKKIWANTITSLEEYQGLFDTVTEQKAIGEASPLYLAWSELSARSIKRHIPNVKLVACLRQPSDRAFSHFLHNIRLGAEQKQDFLKLFQNNSDHYYFKLGKYYQLLKPYYKRFAPNQIRIYLFDDLLEDPKNCLADLFSFLEVDQDFQVDLSKKHNESKIPRNNFLQQITESRVVKILPTKLQNKCQKAVNKINGHKPVLSAKTREVLTKYFYDDIVSLQSLIARDLSHWLM